jgi:hypothetical protein
MGRREYLINPSQGLETHEKLNRVGKGISHQGKMVASQKKSVILNNTLQYPDFNLAKCDSLIQKNSMQIFRQRKAGTNPSENSIQSKLR